MTQYWYLQNSQRHTDFALAVPDFAAALGLRGERVSGDDQSNCKVDALEIAGRRYFVKHYRALKPSLRHFFGASRVRTEWNNLQFFRSLDIPTPDPVAIGERRQWGVFREGILVTEEVPDALDLEQLANTHNSYLHDRSWFSSLCRELATPLRRLHDNGFTHNDLNWRNVLLTLEPSLKVYFFDCPTGRRWPWPFLQFRIVKDLTHLDKLGRSYLRRSQRLRFYLTYAGHDRLDDKDKRLLHRVLRRDVKTVSLPQWLVDAESGNP
jgi:tRNA A-37 threonylcarbamoyl transferase component Bud32